VVVYEMIIGSTPFTTRKPDDMAGLRIKEMMSEIIAIRLYVVFPLK